MSKHTPGPWRVWPPRQMTGLPSFRYYGYIGRRRREEHCHDGYHRSSIAAMKCATKAAIDKAKGEA